MTPLADRPLVDRPTNTFTAQTSRFAIVSQEEIEAQRKSKPSSTVKTTESHLRTWQAWCDNLPTEKQPQVRLEDIEPQELAPLLEKFVMEVRKQNGTHYCVQSLIGKVDAIFRVINESRIEQGLTPYVYYGKTRTPGFHSFVKVFDQEIAKLTKIGLKSKVLPGSSHFLYPLLENETKDCITVEERNKILAQLDPKIPAELQLRVFLAAGTWFSWRGRKGHYCRETHEISGPFFEKDDEYYSFNLDVSLDGNKNHEPTVKAAKAHQEPGTQYLYKSADPVAFQDLHLYLEKMPRGNHFFYLRPHVHTRGNNKGLPVHPNGPWINPKVGVVKT